MARQNIGIGSSANDGNGDTLRTAGGKINDNFVEIYRFLGGGDSDNLSAQITLEDSAVVFEGATADGNEMRLTTVEPTADRQIQLPDADGIVTLNAATQTLTNKTITNPLITDPKVGSSIQDSSGSEIFLLSKNGSGSGINHFNIQHAIAANPIRIAAASSGTNVKMEIAAKGTGAVEINKVSVKSLEKTADGNVLASDNATHIICNKGSALALTLADGTHSGEMKIFTNKGAGVATITVTNFKSTGGTTSFAIAQNEAAQCIWDGSHWFLIGNQSVTTLA